MWETTDPDGRKVLLTEERWAHALVRHPYIGVDPQQIVDVVAQPDMRTFGRESGEESFYRWGVGPSAWMRVVVHYEQRHGLVATAFPRRAYP